MIACLNASSSLSQSFNGTNNKRLGNELLCNIVWKSLYIYYIMKYKYESETSSNG